MTETAIYTRPAALEDVSMHYCPGCGHGIVHRLVAELFGADTKVIDAQVSLQYRIDRQLFQPVACPSAHVIDIHCALYASLCRMIAPLSADSARREYRAR